MTDYIDPAFGLAVATILALTYTVIEIRIARRRHRQEGDRG